MNLPLLENQCIKNKIYTVNKLSIAEYSNCKFTNCKMHSVEFTETELKNASFADCDLKASIFDMTNLKNADFYSAYNFSIHPSNNQVKNAVFSEENCIGLLNSYNIRIK